MFFQISPLFFIFFSISTLLLLDLVLGQHPNGPFVQGKLFIVLKPTSGYYSEQNPQIINHNRLLWCQATENSIDRLEIKEAKFVHTFPKPDKIFPARYNMESDRAFLDFGYNISMASAIGKYRCEITTENDENVHY